MMVLKLLIITCFVAFQMCVRSSCSLLVTNVRNSTDGSAATSSPLNLAETEQLLKHISFKIRRYRNSPDCAKAIRMFGSCNEDAVIPGIFLFVLQAQCRLTKVLCPSPDPGFREFVKTMGSTILNDAAAATLLVDRALSANNSVELCPLDPEAVLVRTSTVLSEWAVKANAICYYNRSQKKPMFKEPPEIVLLQSGSESKPQVPTTVRPTEREPRDQSAEGEEGHSNQQSPADEQNWNPWYLLVLPIPIGIGVLSCVYFKPFKFCRTCRTCSGCCLSDLRKAQQNSLRFVNNNGAVEGAQRQIPSDSWRNSWFGRFRWGRDFIEPIYESIRYISSLRHQSKGGSRNSKSVSSLAVADNSNAETEKSSRRPLPTTVHMAEEELEPLEAIDDGELNEPPVSAPSMKVCENLYENVGFERFRRSGVEESAYDLIPPCSESIC